MVSADEKETTTEAEGERLKLDEALEFIAVAEELDKRQEDPQSSDGRQMRRRPTIAALPAGDRP